MLVQRAAVTWHGTPDAMETGPRSSEFLVRVEIPHEKRPGFLADVERLGINEAFLFPDLEHVAAWLRSRKFILPKHSKPEG